MEIGETKPRSRQGINVRGGVSLTAVATELALAKIIRDDQHDVRLLCGGKTDNCQAGDQNPKVNA